MAIFIDIHQENAKKDMSTLIYTPQIFYLNIDFVLQLKKTQVFKHEYLQHVIVINQVGVHFT